MVSKTVQRVCEQWVAVDLDASRRLLRMQMNKALCLVQAHPCSQRRSCRCAANPRVYDNGQDRGEGPPTRAVQYLVQYLVQPPTQPVPSPHGTALGQGVRCLDNVCQPGARDEAISSHLNKRSSQPHHLVRHLILLRSLISALLDKTALALIRHFALRSVRLHIRITRFRDSTPSFFAP